MSLFATQNSHPAKFTPALESCLKAWIRVVSERQQSRRKGSLVDCARAEWRACSPEHTEAGKEIAVTATRYVRIRSRFSLVHT